MKKAKLSHHLKMVLMVVCFVLIYIASTIVSTLLLENSLANFFDVSLIPGTVSVVLIVLLSCLTNLHLSAYKHASLAEIIKISIISLITFVVNTVLSICMEEVKFAWCFITLVFFFVGSCFVFFSHRLFRYLKSKSTRGSEADKQVLIIGAGEAGATILREIQVTDKICYKVVGFVEETAETE